MRRLAAIVVAVTVIPGAVVAQTYGQPYSGQQPTRHGQPHGGSGYGGHDQRSGYGSSFGYRTGSYGDPRAYRPPVRYGQGYDRGGRYGYSPQASGQWTRWSSPPGRGYHDVYGYNDDRAPRGDDRGHYGDRDCYCGTGAYVYDR